MIDLAGLTFDEAKSRFALQIRNFYNQFKQAYESKDEYGVVSLISSDWGSNDRNRIQETKNRIEI